MLFIRFVKLAYHVHGRMLHLVGTVYTFAYTCFVRIIIIIIMIMYR